MEISETEPQKLQYMPAGVTETDITNKDQSSYSPPRNSMGKIDNFVLENRPIASNEISSNPAPIGLLGFSLSIFLNSLITFDFYEENALILVMSFTCGGIAQLLTGIFEWNRGKMYGSVSFCLYGLYWTINPLMYVFVQNGWGNPPDKNSLGFYLLIWGLFTLMLFVGSFKRPITIRFIFGSLFLNYWCMSLFQFTGSEIILKMGGVLGIFCSIVSFYAGSAEILNDVYENRIFPL